MSRLTALGLALVVLLSLMTNPTFAQDDLITACEQFTLTLEEPAIPSDIEGKTDIEEATIEPAETEASPADENSEDSEDTADSNAPHECIIWLKGVNTEGDTLARIYGKDLREADFSGFMLNERNMIGANLSHATLISSYLDGAQLMDASLVGADLTAASLLNTNLTGADLTDAILKGAILTCAIMPNGEYATPDDAAAYEAIVHEDFDCNDLEVNNN